MTVWTKALRAGLLAWAFGCALSVAVQADAVKDVGTKVPSAEEIRQGLFPEDACRADAAACNVARGVVRFSLSAAAFRTGSAELPPALRQQLEVFAEVLRERPPGQGVLRIEGHADASPSVDQGQALSQRRADAVKAYLVSQGVAPDLLVAVGRGARAPRVQADPYAAANRRIEITRTMLN